jgi:hypothetical protein
MLPKRVDSVLLPDPPEPMTRTRRIAIAQKEAPNVQLSGRALRCHARRERTMAQPRSRRARDVVWRESSYAKVDTRWLVALLSNSTGER